MWCERIQKRVAVERPVAFDTDFQSDIRNWPCNTQDHVTIRNLPVVERNLTPLIHLAQTQPCRAGDATAVLAPIGQIDALLAQGIEKRAAGINDKLRIIPVRQCHGVRGHSQISLVQSPPG